MRFEKFLITFLGFLLGVLITLVLTSINIEQMRDDKDTCDSLESAKEIEEMAKSLT